MVASLVRPVALVPRHPSDDHHDDSEGDDFDGDNSAVNIISQNVVVWLVSQPFLDRSQSCCVDLYGLGVGFGRGGMS